MKSRYDVINQLDFPVISFYCSKLSDLDDFKIKCVFGDIPKFNVVNGLLHNENDVIYNNTYIQNKYVGSVLHLLKTSLTDKCIVVDNLKNSEGILPINPKFYHVCDKSKLIFNDDNTVSRKSTPNSKQYLVKLELNELELNDLIKNNFKYMLNKSTNMFELVDLEQQKTNFMKLKIRFLITSELGDIYERLSDYSKLIYFLLSKVELTNSELDSLKDIINFKPNSEQLEKICKREITIQNIIKRCLE